MPKRLFAVLGSIASTILVLLLIAFSNLPSEASPAPRVPDSIPVEATTTSVSATSTVETNAEVLRAVDGDTLAVRLDEEEGEWKIRLLGINTPESVDPRKPVECFGKEASKHMKELVEGRRIRLEADPRADERDKYGRLLRNAILSDGTDVNLLMVRDGYAHALLDYPLDPIRKQQLKAAEQNAKLAGRGLWAPEACDGRP